MAIVIAVSNQKGGVGKTSTTRGVGICLAKNLKTLIVDLEPSANSTDTLCPIFDKNINNVLGDKKFWPMDAVYPATVNEFNLEDEVIHSIEIPNLFIIPSDIYLATLERQIVSITRKEKILDKQLDKIKDKFDVILLDCPPMLSELSMLGIYAADFFIIPIKFERHSLNGIHHLFNSIREIKDVEHFNYRILKNYLDPRNKYMVNKINKALEEFTKAGAVFKTAIRKEEEINKATDERKPLNYFSPKARANEDYENLTNEIREILNV